MYVFIKKYIHIFTANTKYSPFLAAIIKPNDFKIVLTLKEMSRCLQISTDLYFISLNLIGNTKLLQNIEDNKVSQTVLVAPK